MKTTTLVSAFSTLLLFTSAQARSIVLGHHDANRFGAFNAAWISGENPCTGELMKFGANDQSPCGPRFGLGGFGDLHFENCGTEPIQVWQGNNFISNCDFDPKFVGCGFDPNGFGGFEGRYLCHLNDD